MKKMTVQTGYNMFVSAPKLSDILKLKPGKISPVKSALER